LLLRRHYQNLKQQIEPVKEKKVTKEENLKPKKTTKKKKTDKEGDNHGGHHKIENITEH